MILIRYKEDKSQRPTYNDPSPVDNISPDPIFSSSKVNQYIEQDPYTTAGEPITDNDISVSRREKRNPMGNQ